MRFGLCCLGVFADQSMEDRSSAFPCCREICDRRCGRVGGRPELLSGLVRPVLVVVDDIFAQCGEQVPFAMDEGVVEALAPCGADPSLRERVRPWRLRWFA